MSNLKTHAQRLAKIQAKHSGSAAQRPLDAKQSFQVLCQGILRSDCGFCGWSLLTDLDDPSNPRNLVIQDKISKSGTVAFMTVSTAITGKPSKEAQWANFGSLFLVENDEKAELTKVMAGGKLWPDEQLIRSWGFQYLQLREITHVLREPQDGEASDRPDGMILAEAPAEIRGTLELIAF